MLGQHRVLIVDGDFETRLLMARMLNAAGFLPAASADAEEALAALRAGRFDLVLLDVPATSPDSVDACSRIRERSDVPLILMSELSDAKSIVRGLESGADDYVVKPFDRAELISRMRALLRRTGPTFDADASFSLPPVAVGPLKLEFSSHLALLGELDLSLSGKEFLLLYTLATHVGMLLSRKHIFHAVWGDDVYDDSKTLDVHVSRLRKKLDAAGHYGTLLKTIRNRGYMLSSELVNLAAPAAVLAT